MSEKKPDDCHELPCRHERLFEQAKRVPLLPLLDCTTAELHAAVDFRIASGSIDGTFISDLLSVFTSCDVTCAVLSEDLDRLIGRMEPGSPGHVRMLEVRQLFDGLRDVRSYADKERLARTFRNRMLKEWKDR